MKLTKTMIEKKQNNQQLFNLFFFCFIKLTKNKMKMHRLLLRSHRCFVLIMTNCCHLYSLLQSPLLKQGNLWPTTVSQFEVSRVQSGHKVEQNIVFSCSCPTLRQCSSVSEVKFWSWITERINLSCFEQTHSVISVDLCQTPVPSVGHDTLNNAGTSL